MPDIIKLLPDHVANQIAAGEVIQRPASVVKELLENAIDAKATHIQLIIKDSGKTLIRVIDNGIGMSDTDARMCVERHATSKIQKADDLFNINTFGFRGEAMASIAAISHLEIKTKRKDDEVGVKLYIEGSEVKSQEPEVIPDGTDISVKNLFYNVPARRNFLKSNNVEYRHILEEFQRVALVQPNINFSLHHNGELQYQLMTTSLKKRIVDIFGEPINKKIVPVQSETTMAQMKGFIGKPEFAKKRRGEQYFFVNNRFIKHPYFHHAVVNAFEQLLPEGHHPTYFIYLTIPSDRIDINIHPTKTEVNFLDGKMLYSVIVSMIRQGIGKFNLSPSIDFDMDQSLLVHLESDLSKIKPPKIQVDPTYNPFQQQNEYKEKARQKHNLQNWEQLYQNFDHQTKIDVETQESQLESTVNTGENIINHEEPKEINEVASNLIQVAQQFIVSSVKSGLMMIDQQAAHERILYEYFLKRLEKREVSSQQQLFPQHVTFSLKDAELINELKEDLKCMGIYLEAMSNTTFVINGLPNDLPKNEEVTDFLDSLLEGFKNNQTNPETNKNINLALSMAKNMAIKRGASLEKNEMQSIVDRLFACEVPDVSPSGKPTVVILTAAEMNEKFKM